MIEYTYDEVVVGGNIPSLVFAIENKLPIVSTRWKKYQVWDRVTYSDLMEQVYNKMSIPTETKEWDFKTHKEKCFIEDLNELAAALHVHHGFQYPKMTFQHNNGMFIQEDGLRIIASNKFDFLVKAGTYHVFDPEQIINNTFEIKETFNKRENKVIDLLEAKRHITRPHDGLKFKDFFLKEIVSLASDRFYTISYLAGRRLLHHKYADYSVRFEAQRRLKADGFNGHERSDRPGQFRGISLRPQKRIVEKLEYSTYKDEGKFRFYDSTVENYLERILDLELYRWI